jgi:hypothetical protein
MLFAKNFDGFKTQVGDVLIYVTEHSIGETCHLPVQGERWWKKGELSADLCNQFLVQNTMILTGVKGSQVNG